MWVSILPSLTANIMLAWEYWETVRVHVNRGGGGGGSANFFINALHGKVEEVLVIFGTNKYIFLFVLLIASIDPRITKFQFTFVSMNKHCLKLEI